MIELVTHHSLQKSHDSEVPEDELAHAMYQRGRDVVRHTGFPFTIGCSEVGSISHCVFRSAFVKPVASKEVHGHNAWNAVPHLNVVGTS